MPQVNAFEISKFPAILLDGIYYLLFDFVSYYFLIYNSKHLVFAAEMLLNFSKCKNNN